MDQENKSVSVCIDGVPIFGCVGIDDCNPITSLSVQDCLEVYYNHKDKEQVFCGIDNIPIWTFNGYIIDTPKSWFLTISVN